MKQSQTTRNKALEINKSANFYGTFAEIGAGQEVARHFFQAGLASQTVAKSMSAYDKTFSDSIYGKGSRFVSEERLIKMLEHEFALLGERLPDKKTSTCFFAYASTVATSSHEEVPSCHGWMGIRFQKRADGPINDILIHVRMLDRLRLQQQDALGILGVNLIYAAFKHISDGGTDLITSFLDNLSTDRIEINFVRFSGPDVEHIDNRLMSLELVQQNITRCVMFNTKGEPLSAMDALYKKPVLVQRGTFRPVTIINSNILDSGVQHMSLQLKDKKSDLVVMSELTMAHLTAGGSGTIDQRDFLDRVDTLSLLGHNVMVTNFPLFSQLHVELRKFTDNLIGIAMGALALPTLFNASYYAKYPGGLLGAFGDLLDDRTMILVFPYKTDKECMTAESYKPAPEIQHFYKHLMVNGRLIDMQNCDVTQTSLQSDEIRKLMSKGDPQWEKYVPAKVRDIIKKRKLFGVK
jgi:hypothetical protein